MATNGQYGVGIFLNARQNVSRPARAAGRSMRALSGKVVQSAQMIGRATQAARGGIMLMVAGLKSLRGMFNIAQQAGKFEQEMVAVQAIMGLTTKHLREMERIAVQAGLSTQFSPLESARAMRALAQAGLTAKESVQVLRPALDLAAVSLGKLSPQRAAGVANATLKAFGLQAHQAKSAMNSLVNTTNRFNITVEQLPIGIGNMSRGVIALRQGMDDSLIALGIVKNVLPDVSNAATLTSSAMLRIADPTVQAKLKQLGIRFKNARGDFLPFVEIVHHMNKRLSEKFPRAVDKAGCRRQATRQTRDRPILDHQQATDHWPQRHGWRLAKRHRRDQVHEAPV